jgi:hypothetical protein
MQFSQFSCHFIALWSKYPPQHPAFNHPQSMCPSVLNVFTAINSLISFPFIISVSQYNDLWPRVLCGSAVVEALCYKPNGRGFDSRWDNWTFFILPNPPAALGHGVYSVSNRNEYQKQKK